jgi:phenylalanyl-tRNA synthetase beta subunit
MGQKLGVFGQIHPILANQLNLSSEIYLFEFDVEVNSKSTSKK